MDIRTVQDSRYFAERSKFKRKCKCGHSTSISPTKEKVICSWCGSYIFANKRDEFLYRLNEAKSKEVK